MKAIPPEVLGILKQRYGLKKIEQVPFNPKRTPSIKNEQKIETIFLLDESGARMTTLISGETVADALDLLDENAVDVEFVLSREDETVSTLFDL